MPCLMGTSLKENDMERVTKMDGTKEKFALVPGRDDDVTPDEKSREIGIWDFHNGGSFEFVKTIVYNYAHSRTILASSHTD